ncbi:Dak1 domain-containing protein [Tricladium varicosporioides]|nr:Dak1 domain-containing protein [Hymenoscyphus varicosporioides]
MSTLSNSFLREELSGFLDMTVGKHFITGVEDPVERALRNTLLNHEDFRLIADEKVLFRLQPPNSRKVILVSGGGSGHEPAHSSFIGEGMLDVVISGNIFASPSASQIYAGLRAVDAPEGSLLIVKNYTGDKLNFGLAAEKAKVDGRQVNMVVIEDDVSIEGNTLVGRRGLAGVVFVHKIAGAAAAKGLGLEEVTRIAQKTADSLRTVGVSLDKCSVPQRSDQEKLDVNEVEYGMGIHNEPGARRGQIGCLQETVMEVLQLLLRKLRENSIPVAVMINNLGGLSVLELNVIAEEVFSQLHEQGLNIERTFIGTFVTSLNGPGFSVTILDLDSQVKELLDAPTSVSAWPRSSLPFSPERIQQQLVTSKPRTILKQIRQTTQLIVPKGFLLEIITCVAKSIELDEPLITRYDTLAGDGDCGETLLNGIHAILQDEYTSEPKSYDIVSIFQRISSVVEKSMGGTSGAIYAIFFNAVSSSLKMKINSGIPDLNLTETLAEALQSGLVELCRYTGARKGHRTLMDALIPFIEMFSKTLNLKKAVKSASEGAENTREMGAFFGRASYVAKEQFKKEGGIPDPGALGVVSVVNGILAAISKGD